MISKPVDCTGDNVEILDKWHEFNAAIYDTIFVVKGAELHTIQRYLNGRNR